ncbi:hypothetical protein PDESU_06148 [Pontiella desulfatans]|uniref:IPT/TIG domain-containing protein n=1 Tax=Pontiella desulfatans TaxID=2750659 RepID=A0A6C2UDQ4_PONDE|nr:hypothetical protein [Pontiella desulfatans]VGO17551.1 hypothetical protein PDESU_06148 [Pontiella desulfatans]
MKRKYVSKATCGLVGCLLASMVLINEARADGTEQLGLPSIPIAPGSEILVEGVGLVNGQPGEISIAIPADVAIAQVLLYWTGRPRYDDYVVVDTIQLNGTNISGEIIGGPTPLLGWPSTSYRADITAMSSDLDWLLVGQTNVLYVEGLDFTYANDGAAVVVILDDGTMAEIQIMDGNDFAYLPYVIYDDPSIPVDFQTVPVNFAFAPSSEPRVGTISIIVSDIAVPRPAAINITVDGVTTQLVDALQDNEGSFLDVVELDVPVPAGATEVTVQLLSIDDGSGREPASLAWTFVSWELEKPTGEGCTYTIGYWKTHPYDWPTEELSLFTKHEAILTLWSPPKGGNAYLILAHQYIGAELNIVNGTAVPDEVLKAGFKAYYLIQKYQNKGTIPKKSPDRALAIDLAGILDDYNNGDIGPGHCAD